jgi:hypothetical protein
MEDVPMLEEVPELEEEQELLVYEAAAAAAEEEEQQEVLEEEDDHLQPYQLPIFIEMSWCISKKHSCTGWMSSMNTRECCLSSNSNGMKMLIYYS